MTREDIKKLIDSCDPKTAEEVKELRIEAGKHFTELNISTSMATQMLYNLGEHAYQEGCREQWAEYAHKKVNSSCCGCWTAIFVVCGLALLAKFIF